MRATRSGLVGVQHSLSFLCPLHVGPIVCVEFEAGDRRAEKFEKGRRLAGRWEMRIKFQGT